MSLLCITSKVLLFIYEFNKRNCVILTMPYLGILSSVCQYLLWFEVFIVSHSKDKNANPKFTYKDRYIAAVMGGCGSLKVISNVAIC